jgi:hypothetical protein
MKKIILLIVCISTTCLLFGQKITTENEEPKAPVAYFGIGTGLNFGGIGTRITLLPLKRLDLYAGLGYAIVGFGYNIGAHFRAAPNSRVSPIFGAMYGYNGIIKVQGLEKFNKIYYGFSLSGGIQLKSKRNSNFFSAELIIPLRHQDFYDDWDTVKSQPNVTVKSEPLPIAISLGYHFAFE